MSWTSCALLYVDVESLKDLQIIGTLESATSSTPADSRWCSSHFAVILVMNIASNRCVAVLVLIWGVGLKASLPFVKPAGKSKGHHSEVRNGTIRESIHDILLSKAECGHGKNAMAKNCTFQCLRMIRVWFPGPNWSYDK